MNDLERISYPSVLPVTLAQAKDWIGHGDAFSDDDDMIYGMMAQAVDALEQDMSRKFVDQKWKWYPWRFGNQDPKKCQGVIMYLPLGNNRDLTITYKDSDGATQTFPATDYTLFSNGDTAGPGRIELKEDTEWPTDILDEPRAITFEFNCGWPYGRQWETDETPAVGTVIIPTPAKRMNRAAYRYTVSGLVGSTEPDYPAEIGGTVADGAAILENIGPTVPFDIETAILTKIGDLYNHRETILLYPNKNILATISSRVWKGRLFV